MSQTVVTNRGFTLALAMFACASLLGISCTSNDSRKVADSAAEAYRRQTWATPIKRPGLPNLYKVSDSLYRGAQPTAEGRKQLEEMGIRTIVNLRSFSSDRDGPGETSLAHENIPMKAWHAEDEDLARFLRIVTDPARTPVFVHCEYGADRTGMVCAAYRVVVQGWTRDQAVEEMTRGGFGFHTIWNNLADHIRNLDVDALKRRAGLSLN